MAQVPGGSQTGQPSLGQRHPGAADAGTVADREDVRPGGAAIIDTVDDKGAEAAAFEPMAAGSETPPALAGGQDYPQFLGPDRRATLTGPA